MSELLNARLNQSYFFKFLNETFDIVMDLSISTIRFYLGFLLVDNFINCNAFISWCVEVSVLEFCLNRFFKYLIEKYYPKIIQSAFFDFFVPKLLALWIVSFVFHQSLLVLLFSQALYWLFTFYSKLFCRMLIESLTLFYYYQNPWIVFPVVINLLLSLLYFIDSFFQLGILNFVSHFPFFEHLFKEWGFAIIQDRTSLHDYRKQDESSELPGLTNEEHYQYSILKNKYLTHLTPKTLKDHFDTLKNFLADEYYAHQAFYTDKKNHVHVLPLEWSEFEKIRLKVPSHERVSMLKSYYANPYHAAWRMLSPENPWASNDVKSSNSRQKLFFDKHLEFVLTVWLAIKNEHGFSQQSDLIKIKSDLFIKVLANTNRFRNLHLNRGRREPDIDDLHADKMGDIKLLLSTLLPIVAEKHSDKHLNISILKKFLESYVKSIWIEHFLLLSKEQQQQAALIWKKISNKERHFHEFEDSMNFIKITQHHREDFIVKMNSVYGRSWLNKKELVATVDAYFTHHQPHLHSNLNEVVQELDFMVEHHIYCV